MEHYRDRYLTPEEFPHRQRGGLAVRQGINYAFFMENIVPNVAFLNLPQLRM
jgi:hypothetical protein